jgi:nicotinate-nucleotide adenylyltransferase
MGMIGILGGTFDPVHFGHLRPALEIQQFLGLQEVRLVPCRIPPHRPQPQASASQRVAMLEAAIRNHPVFHIDTRELEREGPSWTLDTLVSLRRELGGQGICLLLGMDAFRGLSSWHRWRELPDYCHMVVMTRPGTMLPDQGELADFIGLHRVLDATALEQHATGLLFFHPVSQLEISGTRIREQLAAGQDPGFLLPDPVIDIINKEGLYATGNRHEG